MAAMLNTRCEIVNSNNKQMFIANKGIVHVFYAQTLARQGGNGLNIRPLGRVFKDLPQVSMQ